ncbi:MAG: DUF554 domain-containing protein [Turicibacter sp.]|nr:DUF554 domain-containing protein [Turicibacter sp.]
MISPVVNALAVVMGSLIGLGLKKGIPERLTDSTMKALGLCTIFIGIRGILVGENTLVLIISMVLGVLIGESLDLDLRISRLGEWVERKFKKEDGENLGIAEGFVTATLLFCVGAMAIVGSLQSGLTGDHETIFTKSVLDFVAAIVFASTKGVGVIFSAVAILLYQGSIVILASWVSPFLTTVVIQEMTAIGSLIIFALGLNMLGITKIKVMNLVPAIFLPILLLLFL